MIRFFSGLKKWNKYASSFTYDKVGVIGFQSMKKNITVVLIFNPLLTSFRG